MKVAQASLPVNLNVSLNDLLKTTPVIFWFVNKTSFQGIVNNVIHFFQVFFLIPDNPVVILILPDTARYI